MSRTTHMRRVTILALEPYCSTVHHRFTYGKGPLKPLFTPFSLALRTPKVVFELQQFVHLRKSLYLLIFPDLCSRKGGLPETPGKNEGTDSA